MNLVQEVRKVQLIADIEQDIQNAEELLGYIDDELSHCRDDDMQAAFHQMRPRVLQALDQKKFVRDNLNAELDELKERLCPMTRSTRFL